MSFILNKIPLNYPYNVFVMSFGIAVIVIMSVILIGYIINKIECIVYRILMRFCGNTVANVVCNYVTFVGIMIHELSHALFARLFGAQINEIKLIEFNNNGTLGHVIFTPQGGRIKRSIQMTMTSCAPVITGILLQCLFVKLWMMYDMSFWLHVLLIYVMISVFCHMSMSNVDIKNYLKGSWFLFIMIMISIVLIYQLNCFT